ncbi:tyrosinase family protein [Kineococcus sp. SYSU DK003]|uniref:tyrosinase family protein n=1 Tax=Kineococcus sp. SYSU DK003 TaxID=3383124 RepID=UPI003D7C8D17
MNILDMSQAEVDAFTAALDVLKSEGTYDDFTRRHTAAMNTPTPVGSSRNVAHSGPAFTPWHRAFLLEFETELLAVDPTLPGLPYWAWEVEAERNEGDAARSVLWTAGYLGSDGDPDEDDRVPDGPFADWDCLLFEVSTGAFVPRATPGIVRRLGRDPNGSSDCPDWAQLTDLMENHTVYDVAPWDATVTGGFRNRLEGWDGHPRMHNQVHTWIGGDMLFATAPNDPAFWLHHCNVDRIWCWWQERYGVDTYEPVSGGPDGHNRGDELRELRTPRTIESVLDVRTLGYRYV